MTFNPASAISILKILKTVDLPDRDLAIDLGSQRYTSSHVFKADSTCDFYIKNGFKQYRSYDVNAAQYNVKCDLNEILPDRGIASLVTNIGVGEHIFDQCSVFTNMHNLCKVGGVMFFHVPFAPWPNHGFYNFNPILFPALAYANKYEMLLFKIGDREGNITKLPYEELVKELGDLALEQVVRVCEKPLFVYCAFRKVVDANFKKPFQGKYRQDIADDQILQRYA